jgi:hypothetical protein
MFGFQYKMAQKRRILTCGRYAGHMPALVKY